MLKSTPADWKSRIAHGEEIRDRMLSARQRMIENYHGAAYDSSNEFMAVGPNAAPRHLENYIFSWMTLVVPRLVSGRPRWQASTPNVDQRGNADALAMALNKWAKDTQVETTLDRACYDFGLDWAVLLVTREEAPGYEEADNPPWRPSATVIDPFRFGFDPMASDFDGARYCWHLTAEDKDDLLERAEESPEDGWNADYIERLCAGRHAELLHKDKQRGEGPDKNLIPYYVVWCREHELEEFPDGYEAPEGHDRPRPELGYNGTLFFVAADTRASQGEFGSGVDDGEWIREPQPFFGPRWGPYVLAGTYVVPDRVEPLSALKAVAEQGEDLNRHARAVQNAMDRRKRILVLNGGNEDALLLNRARDGESIALADFDASMHAEVEIGGVTEQMLATEAVAKQRLHENLGLSEAQRGTAQSDVTATADAIADSAGTMRLSYVGRKWSEAVKRMARTVAWYLWMDEDVVVQLGPEELEQAGFPVQQGAQAFWTGIGNADEKDANSFDMIELELVPGSMERVTLAETQAQTNMALQVATGVAQAALMNPALNVEDILRAFETAYGYPFTKFVDAKMLREIGLANVMLALQAQAQPQQERAPGGQGQRMSGDLGPGGARGGAQRPSLPGRKSEPGMSGLATSLPGRSAGSRAEERKVPA